MSCEDQLSRNSFGRTFSNFMESVVSRDWEAFVGYFDENLPFYAELPGNKVFESVNSFLDSQKAWFFGTTGQFTYSILQLHSDGEEGQGVVLAEYSNVGENGESFTLNIRISFWFQETADGWKLVRDINEVQNL